MTRLSCHTPAPHVPDETSHFGPLEIELRRSILSGKSQRTSLVEMSRTLFWVCLANCNFASRRACAWRIVTWAAFTCRWRITKITRQSAFGISLDNASASDKSRDLLVSDGR